jgi:hypothetical protein
MNYNRIFCNFILCIGIIGLGIQGINDVPNQTKLMNSNINKIIRINKYFITFVYLQKYSQKIILIMNYCLMGSAFMFIINMKNYGFFFFNIALIIELILLNNPVVLQTSKVFLVLSAYFGIYGGLLSLNN